MKPIRLLAVAACVWPATVVSAAVPPDYHRGKSPSDLAASPVSTVDWAETGASLADVSFLLEAPAGRSGRVISRDGHLAFEHGGRFRIWGINATAAGALPAVENAPRLAGALARRGINCVRFHFLDRLAPAGLIAPNRPDTQALDPAQLERLDTFVAELKRRGIYADLNLNVARTYKPGDGVKDHELLGFAKAVTYFDPRLLQLQRDYARQLLTHRNPHTGLTYAEDPAVALVELVNENSLIEAWKDGRLRGTGTRKNPGTWADIPASYAADLTVQFNQWLASHASADDVARWKTEAGVSTDQALPRLPPDALDQASAGRFHAEAEFYLSVEREFFLGMARFLHDDLGVKALLIGNSDHGHHRTGYPQLAGTSLLDVVDGHVYWQHPKYLTDPATGRQTGFTIGNTPMVDDPSHSTVVELSRSAFAGQPYTVSEVNHPFPHEYATEGVPILAAYAAFHDWDGIFWYTLAHREVVGSEARHSGHFDFAPDPVKMAQLTAGALTFLRADVAPAKQTLVRHYSREQVRASLRLGWNERPFFTPGFPALAALVHTTRIGRLEGEPDRTLPQVDVSALRSDTGELDWRSGPAGTGLVTIDTARSQGAVGFIRSGQVRLHHVEIDAQTSFCAITVQSLDPAPLSRARRLLITAGARVANSGQTWNESRTSLTDWGQAPTRIEPVRATLRLRGLEGAARITLTPLDSAGRPMGAGRAVAVTGAVWSFDLTSDTPSYLLSIERSRE